MSYMFADCEISELDTTALDTINISNMSYMFYNCSSLTTFNFFGVQDNVTDTSYMYYNCSRIETTSPIVSNIVTNYTNMFVNTATEPDAYFYISTNINDILVAKMIATKSANSYVISKGHN